MEDVAGLNTVFYDYSDKLASTEQAGLSTGRLQRLLGAAWRPVGAARAATVLSPSNRCLHCFRGEQPDAGISEGPTQI
jgi:hypothetical protein